MNKTAEGLSVQPIGMGSGNGMPHSAGLGNIARYLVLGDLALNPKPDRNHDNTAQAAMERAEQMEAENRMRQVIEKYQAENRRAAMDIKNEAEDKPSDEMRETG